MSERKVLSKYYPPDFDPSKIGRTRGPKKAGPKVSLTHILYFVYPIFQIPHLHLAFSQSALLTSTHQVQTVRLMAPFSMKCTSCGEFIYKGRKFNVSPPFLFSRDPSIPPPP